MLVIVKMMVESAKAELMMTMVWLEGNDESCVGGEAKGVEGMSSGLASMGPSTSKE